MEINWNQIRNEILAETKDVLTTDKNINVIEVINLFFNVLTFPIDDNELKGVETRIANGLQKILVDPISRIDKNAFFSEIANIEQYLRKILFLTNQVFYSEIKENKKGLSAIISYLNLNPKNISYKETSIYSSHTAHFEQHLIKAYNLRNIESHNCIAWTNAKLYDELKSVLIIYLFATYKHFNTLKLAINLFDVSKYIRSEINKIENIQSIFVHIEGREEISEIDLYARELIDENEIENSENGIFGTKKSREGTIDYIRNSIEEKQLIILGDVGMGKTMTLLYIFLKDSKTYLNDAARSIPVLLELKNLTGKETILEKIKGKLGIDNDLSEELLKRGRLNILLDGLNEIENKLKVNVFTQINNLIYDFPDNYYIITSRPQHYNREFDSLINNIKIPVFLLQKMKDDQIDDFLIKNGKQVRSYIFQEINQNERLKKIVQTPLMLRMLIEVVKINGRIPTEKGKIIRAFINNLYNREQRQIIDFDKDLFHLLLCYLGFQTRELTGSNSGLDRDEYILPLLQQRNSQLGTQLDLLIFLRKGIDLSILVCENNQFSFNHELYQEYYAAEYLHQR